MFCILWGGCGSNLTENIAETEAWELVEHAAQFHRAPICETQHFSKFVSFCVAQVCAGNWRKEINIMKRCFFLHSIGRICSSFDLRVPQECVKETKAGQ
jgi:hypothetical protein